MIDLTIKISGTGFTKITDHWSKSLLDISVESAKQAISESNISPDMLIFANTLSSYSSSQENMSTIISEKLGLSNIDSFKIESSSCSGAMAVNVAHKLLSSNDIESVLVIGSEKMTDLSPSETIKATTLGESYEYTQFFGITMNSLYALFTRLYMENYNISSDDLSNFSVLSHKNSSSCKHAQFNREFSLDAINKSSIISSPLNMLNCSPIGDGSASVMLSKTNKSNFHDVNILSSISSNSSIDFYSRDNLLEFNSTANCLNKSLEKSKINLNDIDLLEVHDVVPAITANIIETMGFSDPGSATSDIISGKFDLNSKTSLSCSGGLKARGNPLSATGIYQIAEVTRQLQNRSHVDLQNKKIGLCHNMSGMDSNSVIHILGVAN
ncbi:MAG: hypothetical protein CMO19_03540 [Thaumarchaeota archaeon]|nr:hypothetical protein [Nitrososphaerota archaeon]